MGYECTPRDVKGGILIMEMGRVIVRRKVPKSTQNIINNQQRLVCEMEGSGG
jgi:hypothetical protein